MLGKNGNDETTEKMEKRETAEEVHGRVEGHDRGRSITKGVRTCWEKNVNVGTTGRKKNKRKTEEEVHGCIKEEHDSGWSIRRGSGEQKREERDDLLWQVATHTRRSQEQNNIDRRNASLRFVFLNTSDPLYDYFQKQRRNYWVLVSVVPLHGSGGL